MDAPIKATVGPILIAGEVAEAIITAIKQTNSDVTIVDRGAYLRVEVPLQCFVTGHLIEKALGRSFDLVADLEKVMLSFKGKLSLSTQEVSWKFAQGL